MRILVDENLPRDLITALVALGHDVAYAREVGLLGRPDLDVYAYAVKERRVIVTGDVDFGDTTRFLLGAHSGVVLVRLPMEQPRTQRIERIITALSETDEADLAAGCLVVVTEHTVRVRRFDSEPSQ